MYKKAVGLLLSCIMVLSLMFTVILPYEVPAASSVELLQEFDMEQVKITDPYYVNAFNKEVAYLKKLSADRLVAGFREVAKLPKKADKYGSWESSMIQGHTLGHYLSAIAMAYKNSKSDATLSSELKSRIDYIIDELEACQNKSSNGYLFATAESHFDVIEGKATGSSWVPWYTMHKILTGLIDVYKYEGNPKALNIAKRLGDWVYNRASKWDNNLRSRVLGVEYGGMNDCLYELYKLTGNNNHLTAAHIFDETNLFNTIAAGNNVLPGKHANTTIPKFVGALNRYRTLGSSESSYLNAAQKFFEIVLRDHTYVTGGNSENELFRQAGKLYATLSNVNNETCNTYNMLKLSRELFKVTADVKYADFYERTYINAIMSSQHPETGMTMYFQPMATGYFKVFGSETNHFWCCTGTGMENFTKLNDSLYFHNNTDVYVNMYLSSTLNWSEKGFSFTQAADLENSNKVNFTINSAPSTSINLKFRSPSWIPAGQNITVLVNGTAVNATKTNGYISVNRVWNVGDKVELNIPMEVQVSRLPDKTDCVAFTYGPFVLSAGLGTENMTTASHGVNVLKPTKNVTIKDYILITDSVDTWLSNIKTNLVKTPGMAEFTLRNTDEDNRLKFTLHYKRYKDRYGIYFTLMKMDQAALEAYLRAKKEAEERENLTIDSVPVTNDQYELLHNLQGNSTGGSFGGLMYRHANVNPNTNGAASSVTGTGWFSYDMTVIPTVTNYLVVKYYSGDAGRTFNVYIDDKLLKEETVQSRNPTSFYEVQYKIPSDWIAGKTKVTVKFANRGSSIVGGVFGTIYILRDPNEATPVVTPTPVPTPTSDSDRTILDSLHVANDFSHNLKGNSSSGTFRGLTYRHANVNPSTNGPASSVTGDAWFSYDMKVDPAMTNYLVVKYYSGDAGRTFNLYIDDKLLKEETVQPKNPTDFYDVEYKIPSDWIAGKSQVTVKFANRGASLVGGVFENIYILGERSEVAPTPTPNGVLRGDINKDGKVNSIDFASLRLHLLGVTRLAEDQTIYADVNGDNVVNSIDFAFMRQYLLGIISSFN